MTVKLVFVTSSPVTFRGSVGTAEVNELHDKKFNPLTVNLACCKRECVEMLQSLKPLTCYRTGWSSVSWKTLTHVNLSTESSNTRRVTNCCNMYQ